MGHVTIALWVALGTSCLLSQNRSEQVHWRLVDHVSWINGLSPPNAASYTALLSFY